MGSISRASRIADEVSFFKRLFRDCDIIFTDSIANDLIQILGQGRRLTIKFGVDPTATQLHLGWMVPLRRLRELQNRGHEVILVIGDTTAQIGDPTGKSATRKMLSEQEVNVNIESLLPAFGKVLDMSRTRVVRNSAWWGKMSATDLLSICSTVTVSQILERNDFSNRLENNQSVGLHEILYPIFQAHDSVKIGCDIELGGSDQRFNCLLGRDLMHRADMSPQMVVLTPLLVGTDGTHKMSQSLGNIVSITDAPEDMFGKVMSIPDNLIANWWTLLQIPFEERLDDLQNGVNPKIIKKELASHIVRILCGDEAAERAVNHFEMTFEKCDWQSNAVELCVDFPESPRSLASCMVECGLVTSTSEARRLIQNGAVELGGVKIDNPMLSVTANDIQDKFIKVGKRRFAKLVVTQ